MILTTPKLWGFVWKPMAVALLVYVALVALVALWVLPMIIGAFDLPGWLDQVTTWLGRLGLMALMSFVAVPIYLAISGLFSSFLWERLSVEVERHVYGDAPNPRIGCRAIVFDSVTRAAFAFALFLLSLCFFWIGPIAGCTYAAWIGILDFSASAYMRRGVLFPAELRRVWKPRGSMGFAVCCGILSLFPWLFVLMLPGMVAGATLLCRQADQP